jgi:hypothetical protein
MRASCDQCADDHADEETNPQHHDIESGPFSEPFEVRRRRRHLRPACKRLPPGVNRRGRLIERGQQC